MRFRLDAPRRWLSPSPPLAAAWLRGSAARYAKKAKTLPDLLVSIAALRKSSFPRDHTELTRQADYLMAFENSTEQFKPSEVRPPSTVALLPSNAEYQSFFKSNTKTGCESSFLDFGNDDIYGTKQPMLAENFTGYDGRLPTLLPDFAMRAAMQVWENSDMPLEGSEKQLMDSLTQSNPKAWEQAKDAFPQLANVSIDLMKAYTLNEINHYDRNDWIDDMAVAAGHPVDLPGRGKHDSTLGLSQISPKGVEQFERQYPQLKQFLNSKGYGPGKEALALLDPDCVPMIVAAKTASIVHDMQNHGIKHPTTEQIAYAYNPDVYSYSEHGHKTYKSLYQGEVYASKAQHWDQQKEYYAKSGDVIGASKHIKNVLQCMSQL